MVVKFPPRYLDPIDSDLAEAIRWFVLHNDAQTVEDLARLSGANPAVIDQLLDRAVEQVGGVG